MAPDDIELACRMSGRSLDELWLAYVEMGGSRSRGELRRRLAGSPWPRREDRYLAVVADEALWDSGLPGIALSTWSAPDPGLPLGADSSASALDEARVLRLKLSSLIERCTTVREASRGVREHAAAVRRAGKGRSAPL